MPNTRLVSLAISSRRGEGKLNSRDRKQFPGRQKIIVSKKWGFTNLSRADYLEKRSIAQKDGAYLQFVKPHGPLEENLRRLDRIGA